ARHGADRESGFAGEERQRPEAPCELAEVHAAEAAFGRGAVPQRAGETREAHAFRRQRAIGDAGGEQGDEAAQEYREADRDQAPGARHRQRSSVTVAFTRPAASFEGLKPAACTRSAYSADTSPSHSTRSSKAAFSKTSWIALSWFGVLRWSAL